MALTRQTDFEDRAENALIDKLRTPVQVSVQRILARQVQELEDAALDVFEAAIANAVGVKLDQFGAVVGEARFGRADTPYRLAIQTRILINLSSGTREDIIGVLLGLLGPTADIEVTKIAQKKFTADVLTPVDFDAVPPDRVEAAMEAATVAGEGFQVSMFPATPKAFDTVGQGFDGPAVFGGSVGTSFKDG